ncbi:hypothetical protein KSC_085020 [Ktedonobacter sp. SOSP1-52]|uniref:helix-turn-helix domain-containing protein n=1 Tax=Ktedonobacter sp. SOSP1-52 TaxID=2778366 RepID=UPI0019162F2D|nr:helix-turn-helix domain-containing protein [Ktedonobacter sp. SOSP1-52]GHO69610.1 hypothetical protein KSC_085020 [Ktedonobacter sp. SOSP1-52]
MDPLLTSDELAAILKVDVVTIRRLVNRQEITAYRVGNEFRFTETELEQYLQRQRLPAKGERSEPNGFQGFMRRLMGKPTGGHDRFERFTRRARNVLALAQKEAVGLNHNYIGTEHLLLGLIKEDGGIAGRVLHEQGVSLEQVHERITSIIGKGDKPSAGEGTLTPRSRKVIEYAVDEAKRLGHPFVGTEHILLGLIREGEGIAAHVLRDVLRTERLDSVREAVLRILDQEGVTAENIPPIPEEANSLLSEQEEALTCSVCSARCPTYFHYCFNCGVPFES